MQWRSRDDLPNAGSKVAIVSSSGKVRTGEVVDYSRRVYIRKDLTIPWDRVVAWVKARDLIL